MFRFKKYAEEELLIIENLLSQLPSKPQKPKGSLLLYDGKRDKTLFLRFFTKSPSGAKISKTIPIGDPNSEDAQSLKRDYYVYELYRRLEANRKALIDFLENYLPYDTDSVENALPKASHVITLRSSIFDNLNFDHLEWMNAEYPRLEMDNPTPHYSMQGKILRSKSEVIIANFLEAHHIPFRVDAQLELIDELGVTTNRYPDFTILTPCGKLLYWEHLGRLSSHNYSNRTLLKLDLYAKNGIHPGNNLILSSESADGEIDSASILELYNCFVRKYFR